jgi:hypothetical protein
MANRTVSQIGIAAGIVLFCGFCGWRSVRLALVPDSNDAEYHFGMWEAAPERLAELERALALNPRYTAAWIARGLDAETAGDRQKAEESLLRAAGTDQTYLPRWTLANFYARAADMPQFWVWAHRTAGMAHEPAALFQLCWRVSGDAEEILDRAIPPSPPLRRDYLDFLLRTGRVDAAEPLAAELARNADAASLDLLLRYCDAALAQRRTQPALRVWNTLAARRLIPDAPGRGFNWRTTNMNGTSVSFDPDLHETAVALSGKQPEYSDLMERYAAVEPGAKYSFHFVHRGTVSGLSWNIVDAGAEFAELLLDGSGDQTLRFSIPAGCNLARIILRYRRPPGSMRAEGVVVFTRFALERAD